LLAENSTVDSEHNNGSTTITEEDISPVTKTPTNDINDDDSIISESTAVTNEIDKLWKAIEAINRKFDFESLAKPTQSQVEALQRKLGEYKLKCANYEEKIHNLQQERASLMEAIRILSTDQTLRTQDSQPTSMEWH